MPATPMNGKPTAFRQRSSWQIQRDVVAGLVLRELKSRFSRHRLGFVMVFVEPILHLAGIMLFFGYFRNLGQAFGGYPALLLIAIMPFLIFKRVTLGLMRGVGPGRALLVFKQISSLDVLVARAMADVGISVMVYSILLAGMAWFGLFTLPADPASLLIVQLLAIPLGFGLGLFLCVLRGLIPELEFFIRVSFMPLYLISGVIHPLYIMPEPVARLIVWNPLLCISELSRHHFFDNYPMPYPVSSWYVAFCALCIVFLGMRSFLVNASRIDRVV